jgi:hypothetical protein
MLLVVIASFQCILRLSGDRTNSRQIPASFLSLAIAALHPPPDPSLRPLYITIASKAVWQLMNLIDGRESLDSDLVSKLIALRSAIPDDVRFFRVWQNFILVLCGLFQQQPELTSLVTTAIDTVIEAIPLFLHPPFAQSPRTRRFLEKLTVICSCQKTFAFQMHNRIFASLWLVATNLDASLETVRAAFELIQVFVSPDFFRGRSGLQLDFLEQAVGSLELLRADVEAAERVLSVDVWVDVQARLMRYVATSMHQPEAGGPDAACVDFFSRLFAYVSWLLDAGGRSADGAPDDPLAALRGDAPPRRFRDKISRFVRAFVPDFAPPVSSRCTRAR